ncbi:FMN-binding protein [Demequina pelophila]|uniref:FMN-binding protein n=1 Tax=Demequina pelophila TaxID=1638984 RepID=UPI000781620A|nr:FMN-binding protein [Demequina pelophila]
MAVTRAGGALAFAGAAGVLLSACGGDAESTQAGFDEAPSAVVDSADDAAVADATAEAGASEAAGSAGSYADGVYDGPRVVNARGGYQAQVTIEGGVITSVGAIEAGTDAPESLEVNAFAVPELVDRVLAAQSADVDHVSGSSFTSPAFLESVQGALDDAAA